VLRGGACASPGNSGPTLLAEAVRAAAAGDSLVSPSVAVRLLRHVAADPTSEPVVPARPARATEPPTDRELDVVRLVALGRTNVELAAWPWQHGHARPES
jgi:DNA-binding NarL/FixJ family response regulator